MRIVLEDGKLVDLENVVLLDDEPGRRDDDNELERRDDDSELGRREVVVTELRLEIDERDDEDEIERDGVRVRDDETLDVEGARREDDEEEIFRDRDFELPCEVSTEMSTKAQLNHTTTKKRVTLENLHMFCIAPTGATDQLATFGL